VNLDDFRAPTEAEVEEARKALEPAAPRFRDAALKLARLTFSRTRPTLPPGAEPVRERTTARQLSFGADPARAPAAPPPPPPPPPTPPAPPPPPPPPPPPGPPPPPPNPPPPLLPLPPPPRPPPPPRRSPNPPANPPLRPRPPRILRRLHPSA
jgi:hypothetical protein